MFKFLLIALVFLVIPDALAQTPVFGDVASGAGEPVFTGGGTDAGLDSLFSFLPGSGLIQSDNIIAVILGYVRFALTLVGVIAFVAFVWAGFLYISAFANEENAETAKKVMVWTAIGIVIILISYALTSTLISATL